MIGKRWFWFAAAALLALGGCDGHEHATETGEGADHGHGGGIVITHVSEQTELFVEFPPLAVGRDSPFAAHLTRLSDYRAVDEGKLTVRLTGGGLPEESFSADPSGTAGIFRPVARPRHAGSRELRFEIETPAFTSIHDVGDVTVYPLAQAAEAALPEEEEENGLVSFLKEQQWNVPFRVESVELRTLHPSVPATARLRGTADGEAQLVALTAGRVSPAEGGFPAVGREVSTGDILAYIAPRAGGERDVAALRASLVQAEAEYELASTDVKRLEGLLAQGAVPERRVTEARARQRSARSALEAARARLAAIGAGSGDAAGVAVRATISGTIAEVGVGQGAYVEAGAPLMRIVRTDRLWLEAAVAEADRHRLRTPERAWFTLDGQDAPVVITPESGRLVTVSRVVDPVTRTIPVIFEFENPSDSLSVGAMVSARIATGEEVRGPAIPVSAVVDEAGQSVVYVMAGGESFERRIVTTGLRDAGYIEVKSGLRAGERIVTEGAYLVRLAASGPAEAGHGHAH